MGIHPMRHCQETGLPKTTASRILELGGFAVEILLDHKRNLEGNCVVELTKVKTGELSDFLKTVNESVSMYEELS